MNFSIKGTIKFCCLFYSCAVSEDKPASKMVINKT